MYLPTQLQRFWRCLIFSCLALGACGSEASETEVSPENWEESHEVISKCLQDKGYDPVIENPHEKVKEDPSFDEALNTCYGKAGLDPPDFERESRMIDAHILATYSCLRDRGWDLPDEPPRGQHGRYIMDSSAIPDDQRESFEQDSDECLQKAGEEVAREFDAE